jgi:molybdenum cofactor biosynthesis protein MoaC
MGRQTISQDSSEETMERPPISPKSPAENFRMIDVGEKAPTRRRAVAQGRITMARETVELIRTKSLSKGDPLPLAEVAGILAAKKTSDIIPLCHPLPLDAVRVHCRLVSEDSIEITCEAITTGKTGVEMEALTGVMAALLTVYDLAKAVDPVIVISDVFLRTKEGGKSGLWVHPQFPALTRGSESTPGQAPSQTLSGVRACVLTVSDRCSRGEAEDRSGPTIQEYLEARGASLLARRVVPDEVGAIQAQARTMASEGAELVLATGGTGLAPRDVTPDAFRALWTRTIPGFGELLRSSGARHTPMSWLSRSEAGFVGSTLFILLPGSAKAVTQGLQALDPLLAHAVEILRGGDHTRPPRG